MGWGMDLDSGMLGCMQRLAQSATPTNSMVCGLLLPQISLEVAESPKTSSSAQQDDTTQREPPKRDFNLAA